jgi:hypothetical protein
MSEIDSIGRRHADLTRLSFGNAEPPPFDALTRSRQEPQRRALLAAMVGAAAVMAALLPVLFLSESRDPAVTSNPVTSEPSQTSTTAGTTPSLPSAFPAVRSSIGLGWESVEIPSSLVALCHRAMVGTDTELIFWGGDQASCDYEFPTGDPGMAYNPDTGMWRQLPESPLDPVVAPTGVWTGSEVIICCGMTSRQAAAYDPQEDTWRSLAQSPLSGPFPKSVWSGTEMFVVTQQGAAAYNPTTGVWRRLPPTPERLGRTNAIVWTGSEIVVWPVFPDGDPLRRVEKGMAFDPTAETWRVLPDPPAWPSWLDMVFTGDSLIIWGGLPAESGGSERAVGSRLDLETNTWTALPEALPEPRGCECNLGSQTLTWTGEYVLVSPGMFSTGVDPSTPVLLAYHPESNTWILVDDETPLAHGGISLTVGERLVIASGRVFYLSPPNWQPTGDTTWNGTSELFAPPFTVENGVYTFTVQMVNGEWLTMTLPESLGSQIEGFESGVALGTSDEMWTGVQVGTRYGTSDDLYKGRVPDETYVDGGGRPVRLYRNDDGHHELVFQFGPWSLIAPGGGGVGLGSERFASVIDGHVTDEGFLVLTSKELELQLPTHSIPNASFISSNRNSVVWFWRFHPGRCLSSGPEFTPESGITSICDPATGDRLMLGSAAELTNEELDAISFAVTTDRPDR